MSVQQVLINGQWVSSKGTETFTAVNPATRAALPDSYPVSPWSEVEQAIQAAAKAFEQVRNWPGEKFAAFLEAYAAGIEARTDALVSMAHQETGLPAEGRLRNGELPRTVNQLKQAAAAARDNAWREPTIDTASNIRSQFGSLGPVVVFGPNNFPFAFNSIAGGDFAAGIAAGNPVIGKGHSSHPGTTRLFAEAAHEAAKATGMPAGFVQLIYRTSHQDGEKLVSHPLIGATGYTGGRHTGLVLKAAADKAGKPIYLELSSVNPVFVLPGALKEKADKVAEEFTASCLLGSGQFCTNPGVVVLAAGKEADAFCETVKQKFATATPTVLLSGGVQKSLHQGVQTLRDAGAELLTGGAPVEGGGFCYQNTLLKTTGSEFLKKPEEFQTEAFGNSSLFVMVDNIDQMVQIAGSLEGNLTGIVYSGESADDAAYTKLEPVLRQKVGRLLNDKMPTGVAVVASMNHGGPYPSTGHPGFTAVGIPASLRRFAMLQCYDNVREHRLPPSLRNKNPTGKLWRKIDGQWSQGNAG